MRISDWSSDVCSSDLDDDQRLVVLEIGFDHRPQAAPAAEEHGDVPGPRGFLDVANPHRMRRTCFLAALATDDDEIGFRRMRQRLVEWQPEPLAAITGATVCLHDAAKWHEADAGTQPALPDVAQDAYRTQAHNAAHRR